MLHNGTEVRDKDGNITGYIYGETADKPVEEAPKAEPKKTTRKTSTTKK